MNENLKRHRPDIKVLGEGKAIAFMPEDPMGVWCHIQEVRDLLDVKDKKIAELKEQYKDMDVTHTVHIAKMNARIEELEENVDFCKKEIRRLKRALWLARAERAKEMCRRLLIQGFDPKWENVERKCRAKADEYK